MKIKKAVWLGLALMLVSCASGNSPENPSPEVDRRFYYENTTWGMTVDEVIELRGTPDARNDVDSSGQVIETSEAVDLIYEGKKALGKYDCDQQFTFNSMGELVGVFEILELMEISSDLKNYDEVMEDTKQKYLEIREDLTAIYGQPAAEYTAYPEGGQYVTKEELDMDIEDFVVHATRWDGDDYRFIYIIWIKNGEALDIRYIPHDKDLVESRKNPEVSQILEKTPPAVEAKPIIT